MSARLRIGLVVGVLALIAAGSAVGLWSLKDTSQSTPDEIAVEVLQPEYDAAFIDVWVRGCVASGERMAFCRCAINEYTARLQTNEFESVSAVANSGGDIAQLPKKVRDVLAYVDRECR